MVSALTIESLNHDVLNEITSFLLPPDLAPLAQTSRRLYTVLLRSFNNSLVLSNDASLLAWQNSLQTPHLPRLPTKSRNARAITIYHEQSASPPLWFFLG